MPLNKHFAIESIASTHILYTMTCNFKIIPCRKIFFFVRPFLSSLLSFYLLLVIIELDRGKVVLVHDDPAPPGCIRGMVNASNDCSKTFFELATEIGTDKVTDHSYQHAYEFYLPSLRHKPVKMLEIGLGCNMRYGPGKSLDLWDRYYTHPNSSIFFIEYDEECAKKWNQAHARVVVDAGDQANVPFLNGFLQHHGCDFDVIIDDGGHTMVQQITSFQNLFLSLKSGGLYFLEDLQTSYMHGYGGGYLRGGTTIEYIKAMIDGFYGHGVGPAIDIVGYIQSINCFTEICVFTKK